MVSSSAFVSSPSSLLYPPTDLVAFTTTEEVEDGSGRVCWERGVGSGARRDGLRRASMVYARVGAYTPRWECNGQRAIASRIHYLLSVRLVWFRPGASIFFLEALLWVFSLEDRLAETLRVSRRTAAVPTATAIAWVRSHSRLFRACRRVERQGLRSGRRSGVPERGESGLRQCACSPLPRLGQEWNRRRRYLQSLHLGLLSLSPSLRLSLPRQQALAQRPHRRLPLPLPSRPLPSRLQSSCLRFSCLLSRPSPSQVRCPARRGAERESLELTATLISQSLARRSRLARPVELSPAPVVLF